jgi:hypothetical protein
MKKYLISFAIWLSIALTITAQKTQLLHFFVEAGTYKRFNTPVCLNLEGINKNDTLSYQLFEKVKGQLIEKPFQIETGYVPLLWWILDGTTNAGQKREFLLYSAAPVKKSDAITTELTTDNIVIKKGNSEILNYRKSVLYPPEGVDSAYKRSGFIHPLYSPSGNILTRISPRDHYHHFGIWNPWTKVRIGDHETDFWNIGSKQGTVRFSGINSVINGPVYGGFIVKQDHIDFQGRKPEEIAINELWDVRTWNMEPVSGLKAYIVDLTTFLSVAGTEPIVFVAYRYAGGIGFRATGEWNNRNSTVLTSEGLTRKNADGSRARWVDINGEFMNKGNSGIIFFSHPSNREHPEPMRVWPENQNGVGDVYFEFCPTRHKDWELYPGNLYRLKYRMLVYDGKIDKATAERLWNDFACPPLVTVSK